MSPAQISPIILIVVVALIGMLGPFSIDTYLPSFPSIEAELSVSREQLTQSLSVYLIFFAVATLIWGPMSDKWGRRPIILISLVGYLAASALSAVAQSYEMLMLGRALQGVMAAGSLATSRAMIRDYFKGEEAQKAMALMMMLFAVAPALAPIIGGWLEVHLGWRSVFYFLGIYALLILLMFFFRVGETQNPEHVQSIHPQQIVLSYWESLLHPVFLRLVIAQGMLIGGFFVYVAGSASLIFDHLHLHEQDFWIFFVPVVSGIIIGSMTVHWLTSRLASSKIINLALVLGSISVLTNITLENLVDVNAWIIIAPLVLYSFGFALINPGLTVVALDCFPTKRGLASSVQSLFQMGMAGLVAGLIVPYVQHSLKLMAMAQGLLLLTTVLLWLSVRKQLADS